MGQYLNDEINRCKNLSKDILEAFERDMTAEQYKNFQIEFGRFTQSKIGRGEPTLLTETANWLIDKRNKFYGSE